MISKISKSHGFTITEAFFVTILWSSSWPIIKFGLEEIPALVFAGFRYIIASGILLLFVLSSKKYRKEVKNLSLSWWLKLLMYGVIFYTLTQGAQFLGLKYLDAITVSLLLSFSPVIVLVFANIILKEKTSLLKILLVFVALAGALFYFLPSPEFNAVAWRTVSGSLQFSETQQETITSFWKIMGLVIVIIGVLANALSAIVGRSINRSKEVSTVVVTTVSMFIGSLLLVISGISIEGVPRLSAISWGYILWLSVVNTAFAFTLWNHAMQKLKAVEISIINNTMLFQITILAVIFLGELPTLIQWFGLIVVAIIGIILPLINTNKQETSKTNISQEVT